MKKVIVLMHALVLSVCGRQFENYDVIQSPRLFHEIIDTTALSNERLAVVLFFPSHEPRNGCDKLKKQRDVACSVKDKNSCDQLRLCYAKCKRNLKSDWHRSMQQLRKAFRITSKSIPDVLFLEVDMCRGCGAELARQYAIPCDTPSYMLFRKGHPVDGEFGKKVVDLKRISQSSLLRFITQGFGNYVEPIKEAVVVYDEFEPNPIQSFSQWDFGAPFYRDSLFPYSGPIYYSMVDEE